jgi:CelD/BcsL family acetyltransferase involved in cellulose biosynthesis
VTSSFPTFLNASCAELDTLLLRNSTQKSIISIDVITTLDQLDSLQDNWDSVHQKDSHATVFTSWAWLRGNFKPQESSLYILAVRSHQEGSYVGFLPLKIRQVERFGLVLERRLEMMGNHGADYTGFVCIPDYEEDILQACGRHLFYQDNWDTMTLNDVLDPRFDRFINYFQKPDSPIDVQVEPGYPCPYITLPQTWDEYLKTAVSASRGKKMRKLLQKVEADRSIQFFMADADNFDQHLTAFFKLHRLRWDTYTDRNLDEFRTFYRWCFDHNILKLFVLVKDGVAIANELLFYDKKYQSLGMYAGGYDPEFAKLSPGQFNMTHLIRDCIDQEFAVLDFLRGDEDYKSSFGCEERWTQHFTLLRSRRSRLIRQLRSQCLQYREKLRRSERWQRLRQVCTIF